MLTFFLQRISICIPSEIEGHGLFSHITSLIKRGLSDTSGQPLLFALFMTDAKGVIFFRTGHRIRHSRKGGIALEIVKIFPVHIREALANDTWKAGLEEIRVRVGSPLEFIYGGESRYLPGREGRVCTAFCLRI